MEKPKLLRCGHCGALAQADPDADKGVCTYCGTEFTVPGKPTELDIFVDQFEQENFTVELAPEHREAIGWLKNSGRVHKLIGADYFDLDNEGITDEDMSYIGKMTFLQELYLGRNDITDDGLAQLAGLTILERLGLNNTPITDKGLACLSGMAKLEVLNLSDTDIGDPGLDYLLTLTILERVNLKGTNVTEKGIGQLTELPNIKKVEIDEEQVNVLPLIRSGLFKKIYTGFGINLDGNGLIDDDLKYLTDYNDVSSLSLKRNNIQGEGLVYLKNFTGLISLSLDENPLGDEGLIYLKGLRKLRMITMYKTKVTKQGARILEKGIRRKGVFYDGMFS